MQYLPYLALLAMSHGGEGKPVGHHGRPPEISVEDLEAAKEEVAELLSDLLEEGIPEPAEKWINIVRGHMAGEHGGKHGPPHPLNP